MSAPTKHCRLGPSSSKRWLCQCHYSAQVDLPDVISVEDTTGGRARNEGDDAHELASDILLGNASISDVPAAWQAGVQMYVDHVQSNDGTYYIEKFWESLAINDFGGTTDCAIINDRKQCAVYDLKTGGWDVPAVGNTQLLSYCSIIAEHYEIDQFFGIIIQPKSVKSMKGKPSKLPKIAEFSKQQVADHHAAVKAASVSTHKQVGPECRFCPLRLTKQCAEGQLYGLQKGWK